MIYISKEISNITYLLILHIHFFHQIEVILFLYFFFFALVSQFLGLARWCSSPVLHSYPCRVLGYFFSAGRIKFLCTALFWSAFVAHTQFFRRL